MRKEGFEMSNFTLVVIDGDFINIYKQETFNESIEKMVELKDREDLKWIFYKQNEILASKGIDD